MRKRPPIMEWQIAETEAEWEALQARPAPERALRQPMRSRRRMVLIFLLMGAVGGWHWWSAGSDPAQNVPMPEQQTVAWGAQQRRATRYFVFLFRQRDAPTVITVAPRIDQLYSTLQQNFGLAAPLDANPLVITVHENRVLENAPYRPRVFAKLSVPSPTLYPANEWNEAELLTQSLALLLIDHTLAHVVRQHAVGAARYPLLDGLRLWQLWELDLPLARWQPTLVRWIYVDLPAAAPEQSLPLPQQYAALCAAHTLWMPHPAQIRIPLLCTALDKSPARLPRPMIHNPPRRLPRLDTPVYPDEEVDAQGKTGPTSHPGAAIAFATLVDYAVTTYGQECLPLFVAGLGQYTTWEELIPAVFGVSAAEFEIGWQHSLE